jgi:hypothetical protein
MRTDDLIAILSGDLAPARRGTVMRWLLLGLVIGTLISAALMMMLLGLRPDLHQAMLGGPFWMKFTYTLALTLIGLIVVQRQARAGADSRYALYALGVPVVALIILSSVQMSAPDADNAAQIMGQSWMVCPWRIVGLALPLLAVLFLALRRLAPTRLTMAGAAAGLVAGSAAATVYGFHCAEFAAPFLLIWYTLGIAVCAGIGAFFGRWALHW